MRQSGLRQPGLRQTNLPTRNPTALVGNTLNYFHHSQQAIKTETSKQASSLICEP
jgi:hypothetical protein